MTAVIELNVATGNDSSHKTDIDHARGELLAAIRSGLSVVDRDRTFTTRELLSLRSVVALIVGDYGAHYTGASLETPGKVAYSDGKTGAFDSRRRRSTTVGRYLVRQIRADTVLHDKLLSAFANAVTAALSNPTIEVLEGDDIMRAYRDSKAESCMSGPDADKVELWAVSDCTKLVVCEELSARALLHRSVDGDYYLDRCYPNNSAGSAVLRHWARSRGYWVRSCDGCVFDHFTHATRGKATAVTIDTCVGVDEIDLWPYADTFKYLRIDDGGDVVLSTDSRLHEYVLNSCCGSGPNTRYCTCCETTMRDDDSITDDGGDDWCCDCYHEHHTECDACGETVHNDDMNSVELYVNGCHQDSQQQCDGCCQHGL